MKKRILLMLSLVALLACAFTMAVSATEWFGNVEYLDGIKVEDHIASPVTAETPELGEPTEAARVKVSCTCEAGYHTFPAYYVVYKINSSTSMEWFDFNDVSANLTCGGEAMSLNNLIAFEFPNGITKIEATLYYQCKEKNLEYLSFAKAKTLTEMGDVQSGKNWFSGAPLEVVDIGPYVTNISPWLCYGCSTLREVIIPEGSKLTTIGNNAFCGNSSLTTIRIPNTVSVIEYSAFKNCTSLTEFRIPSALTSFGAGGSGTSPIDGCKNLYFVHNYGEEKPSVYYFSSAITTFEGEAFKNCTSLNDVLVFPAGVTELANGWAFCNSNAVSVVFLGDMVNVSTTGNAWNSGITIYFCNKNDISTDSVTMNTNAKKVFCYGDGNTTHLKKESKTTEATCTLPAMTGDFCFCGQPFGAVTELAPALGHSYTGAVNYVIPSLTEAVTKCTVCVNNCGIDKEETLAPVYTELGYSVMGFGDSGYSFTNGYNVNLEALNAYEAQNGVTIKFGFGFNAANSFATEGEVTLESFKYTTYPADQSNGVKFSMHEFKLNYADNTHLADDIVIAAYVLEVKGENETLSFINRGQGAANGFETVNYNQALENAK